MHVFRLLTSRRLAAGLMIVLIVVLIAILGSQSGGEGSSRTGSPGAVGLLGLSRPFTAPIMLALWFVIATTMVAASAIRARVAWQRFRVWRPPSDAQREPLGVDRQAFGRHLASRGWIRMRSPDPNIDRFVRNPWSYFSGVALHVGLVLVVVSAGVVKLTEQRAVVSVRPGDVISRDIEYAAETHGPLANELELPGELRVQDVAVGYDSTGDLRVLQTTLHRSSVNVPLTVSVNRIGDWSGIRVYQTVDAGPAYSLHFRGGEQDLGTYVLEMLASSHSGSPTYRDIELPWGPETLRARSIVRAEGKAVNAVLALRLQRDAAVIDEATLIAGEETRLGPYAVTLEDVTWWSSLILVDDTGVALLFVGFLTVAMAAVLLYAAPVREVYVQTRHDSPTMSYRGHGYARADEEHRSLLQLANEKE